MAKLKLVKKDDSHQISKLSFKFKASSALGISIVADLLIIYQTPVFDMHSWEIYLMLSQ